MTCKSQKLLGDTKCSPFNTRWVYKRVFNDAWLTKYTYAKNNVSPSFVQINRVLWYHLGGKHTLRPPMGSQKESLFDPNIPTTPHSSYVYPWSNNSQFLCKTSMKFIIYKVIYEYASKECQFFSSCLYFVYIIWTIY